MDWDGRSRLKHNNFIFLNPDNKYLSSETQIILFNSINYSARFFIPEIPAHASIKDPQTAIPLDM